MAKAQTLEQSFEKLEQIIGNLENGDVSLEDLSNYIMKA